jgi:RNA polymerase primary sigma factor
MMVNERMQGRTSSRLDAVAQAALQTSYDGSRATVRALAERFGVSEQTIRGWARMLGLTRRSRPRKPSHKIIFLPVNSGEEASAEEVTPLEQEAPPTVFSESSGQQDSLDLYLSEMGRYPRLTAHDERRLAASFALGDKRAKDRLVECNLRLVVNIATRIAARYVNQINSRLDILDLIQEGNLGLMHAAETFDPTKGRFSTHATYWIRQHCIRAIHDQARIIRLPVPTHVQLYQLHRLCQQADHELSVEELARRLSLSSERVAELLAAEHDATSLDAKVSQAPHGSQLVLGDCLHSSLPQPETLALASDLREHLQHLLCALKPKEQRVVELRYGLLDGSTRTLEEVSHEFGVTRERVRQIEKKALLQLLQMSVDLCLYDYLEV